MRKGETGVTPVVSALPRIFVVRKGETGVTPFMSALPRILVSGAPPERDQIRFAPSWSSVICCREQTRDTAVV